MAWRCKGCGRVMEGLTRTAPPMHACECKAKMPRKLQILVNAARTAMNDQDVILYLANHSPTEAGYYPYLQNIRGIAELRKHLVDWKSHPEDYVNLGEF